MEDKWEFYKDTNGEWRWKRTAPNGRVVGTSSEGYQNREDCKANAERNGWKRPLEKKLVDSSDAQS